MVVWQGGGMVVWRGGGMVVWRGGGMVVWRGSGHAPGSVAGHLLELAIRMVDEQRARARMCLEHGSAGQHARVPVDAHTHLPSDVERRLARVVACDAIGDSRPRDTARAWDLGWSVGWAVSGVRANPRRARQA